MSAAYAIGTSCLLQRAHTHTNNKFLSLAEQEDMRRLTAQLLGSCHLLARAAFHTHRSHRGLKLGLFLVWLSAVLFAALHHAFWRDEVRALSIALQGASFAEMLESLHGEGHPALWYVLLRTAYVVFASPVVLPVIAIGVAFAAILLLVLRSPFSWWMIALILFGQIALYEYSVMARNYGISALLLFLIAACYPKHRDHGLLLGVLLALLANTNAPSVLLVGAFLLFWLIDIVSEHGTRWSPALKNFSFNVAVSAVGIAICFVTIYPTYNDAAMIRAADGQMLSPLASVLVVAVPFHALIMARVGEALGLSAMSVLVLQCLMSLIIYGSLLGLLRSRAAVISGLAALMALSVLFVTVFEGEYRHQALWLVYLVTLYWIMRDKGASTERRLSGRLESLVAIGSTCFVALVALQVPRGVLSVADAMLDHAPLSRSRDLAELVSHRAELQDAIIIADPDFIVESLPYYIPNRTYLMREQRFGNVVRFTQNARLSLSLDEVLATAVKLRTESGRPVLILLNQKLDPSDPARRYREGYDWEFLTTPEQVRGFLASTRLLARFGPAKEEDESFDVYLYDRL
jgi:hypothetical protein